MTREQFQVLNFHRKAGATINNTPTIASNKDQALRVKLISEEFEELVTAIQMNDMVSIADAIGDLLYVVYGTAVTYGLNMEPIFAAIHKSNMTKFIDGHRREDGKWIKGPSYKPVDLEPIIKEQMMEF